MKRNLLKRSLALAVAVAMTVSSVPTNLVFAEEAIVDEPLVIEETLDDAGAAEVAAVEEEQPEEAAADLQTITLEGAEVIDTADVPADIALGEDAIAPISLKDPFKVSNLRIEEEYGTSYIKWRTDENYETYEFTIKDQLGNTYLAHKYDYDNETDSYVNFTWQPDYENYEGPWDDVDDNGDIRLDVEYLINSVAAWKKGSDGNWSVATNPSDPKEELWGLQNGFTYSISVCAVGTEGDKDAVVGPVSYTYTEEVETVTKPGAPTNFRYDAENEELKWDAPTTGRVDRYRLVITDDLYRYGQVGEGKYVETKDPATGEVTSRTPTYDFKDVNIYRGNSIDISLLNRNHYSYSAYAYPKDKIGTGVGYTEENQPQRVETEDGSYIYPFAPGKTYTVQIYAENSGEDANGNPVTEKSALSAEVKVTVPAVKPVEEAKLGKVGNLKVDEDGEYLSWDAIELEDEDWESWYDLAYVITVKKDNVVVGTPYTTDSKDFYIESYTDIPGTYTFEVYAILQDEDDEEETITVARGETASVSYTVSATRNAGKAKPGKVTGLVLETNNDDVYAYSGIYSNPMIAWNELNDPNMDVDRYDIELTDAAGHVYYLSYDVDVNQTTNVRTPKPKYYSVEDEETSVTVSSFGNCFTYTLPDGTSATRVTGQDGKFLTGFDAGQTYTVRVRAVDEYQTYDAAKKEWTEQENAGEWSETKTYQIGTVSAITDLKYVPDSTGEKGNSSYYFSYTGMPGTVWYQISTDPTFNKDNPNTRGFYSYSVYDDNEYKLQIEKDFFSLPNTTYYVRAVNVFGGSSKAPTQKEADELMKQNPGMMTSFTTDSAVTTAKTITGFKLKKEYDRYFEFVFDPILEEGDSYKLQYSKDKTNWKPYSDGSRYLYKSDLEDGVTYYVRAVAYIYVDGKEVEGTPSAEVSVVVNKAAGAVTGFTMKKTPEGYVFSYANEFHNGEYVTLQVADSMEFPENSRSMIYNDRIGEKQRNYDEDEEEYYDVWTYTGEYTLPYNNLTPGKTYYARARVVSDGAKEDEQYGPWSNIITITPKVANISVSTRGVSSTALYLSMSEASDGDYLDAYLSGYQVQKKKGKKWTTLTYTTDNEYKESGLKANTKYQYRVRPYYYNTETKKYIYGSYVYCEALTWGNALSLKAKAKSKTSVKLTWSKVTGASGYEIYRKVTSSVGTTTKAGFYQDEFDSYRLVKTIKKASTKSYTDKKLTSGMSYSYIVRAYKTINKKKYYISDTATVNLSIKNFQLVDVTYQTSGKTKITWSPIYTAKGYLIEKYDDETEQWSTYADIKKAKTSSYTLPANSTENVEYRIRAYDKDDVYSNMVYAWTSPYLKAPTNVKAAVQSDGSVKVTWNKVAGADYYLVYRTTSSKNWYNKDLKTYEYGVEKNLTNYVEDATTLSGYRATEDDKLTGSEFYDRKIAYTTASGVTNTLWAGPLDGVEYYYYVVPFKKGQTYVWKDKSYILENSVKGYPSKTASATVNGTSIAKPTKVKAKASKGKVKVSWKKVSGAKGYVVYRSTKKKSGFVPVGYISKGSTKSYTDKTAKKGKNYYYKVCAYKLSAAGSYQYSDYSSVKKVKAK